MDGIIYAIAGDEELPKLLFSVESVRKASSLPVFVHAYLSEAGYRQLSDAGIAYKALEKFQWPGADKDLVNVSRFLKTSVHKVTPFKRTIYFDNDIVCVRDPSWIFDNIPKSGIIFARDAGKTVGKFSRYATPGKKLAEEIKRVFKISVDSQWGIWNGGMFVFDENGKKFVDAWHRKQVKLIQGIPGWSKRDQGTLIATVWQKKLQNQECLPCEANFLHGLQNGLKYKDGVWMNASNDTPVTNIHLCLAWGKADSETWQIISGQIEKGTMSPQQIYEKHFGKKKVIVVPSTGKWPRPFRLLIGALTALPDVVTDAEYGLCCDEVTQLLLDKQREDAAVILVDGKAVLIDYSDYVNVSNGPLKHISKRDFKPDLTLKCQFRPDHATYKDCPCPVVPFVYVSVDTHGDDKYILKARKAFQTSASKGEFTYSLFGRLAKHKPRKKLFEIAAKIEKADVKAVAMNNGDHHGGKDGRLPRDQYFAKMAESAFCVDGPGSGNITHRIIEAWAMGQPVICPQLKNAFYRPVEAGIHYIPVAEDYSDLPHVVAKYTKDYDKALQIGKAGMDYYEKYCTKKGIGELLVQILKAEKIC